MCHHLNLLCWIEKKILVVKRNIMIKYNWWGIFFKKSLEVILSYKVMRMDSLNKKSSMNNTYFLPKIQLHFMNHKCKFPCHFITWNVLFWTFESLEKIKFSKAHFGMRMKHFLEISFMHNGYKHKQIGYPRSNFKNLDMV